MPYLLGWTNIEATPLLVGVNDNKATISLLTGTEAMPIFPYCCLHTNHAVLNLSEYLLFRLQSAL